MKHVMYFLAGLVAVAMFVAASVAASYGFGFVVVAVLEWLGAPPYDGSEALRGAIGLNGLAALAIVLGFSYAIGRAVREALEKNR